MRIQIHPATATDLRIHAREILEQARWQAKIFAITLHGTPTAVVMPAELFEEWARAMGVTLVRKSETIPAPAETAEPA